MNRPVSNPLEWYSRELARRPLRTKALTAMTCFGLGEAIGQLIIAGRIDPGSLAFMILFGLCYAGPAGHYWYEALDDAVGRVGLKGGVAITVKVGLDQLVWTPVNTLLFFTSFGLWRGYSFHKAVAHALPLLWPTLRVNWVVWPLILLVTFSVIPLSFHAPFLNLCNVLWAVFLSIVKS